MKDLPDKFAAFTVVDRQRSRRWSSAVPWGSSRAGRLVMVSSGAEKVQIEISELADGGSFPSTRRGVACGPSVITAGLRARR